MKHWGEIRFRARKRNTPIVMQRKMTEERIDAGAEKSAQKQKTGGVLILMAFTFFDVENEVTD